MTIIVALQQDLATLDLDKLGISEYIQMYLESKINRAVLTRAEYVLGQALQGRKPEDCCLIDYGSGVGTLSLLAKKLEIGKVIYNDIYDISCRDARTIAVAVGAEADYYVEGDIDKLIQFCTEHDIKADAIVSQDVLEHIYDIEGFLSKLHLISHEGTVLVHTSGANMFHPQVAEAEIKLQLQVETTGIERKKGYKERDCYTAFRTARAKIITEYAPSLTSLEVQILANNTRGLWQIDILNAVDNYIATGIFPTVIGHPTNTCDPYTGNWAEHLINPYYLVEVLSDNGFKARVLPGKQVSSDKFISKVNACILNSLSWLGRLYFSSYYSLHAVYNKNHSTKTRREKYPNVSRVMTTVSRLFWWVYFRLLRTLVI